MGEWFCEGAVLHPPSFACEDAGCLCVRLFVCLFVCARTVICVCLCVCCSFTASSKLATPSDALPLQVNVPVLRKGGALCLRTAMF